VTQPGWFLSNESTRRQWFGSAGKWIIAPALLSMPIPIESSAEPMSPSSEWKDAELFGLQHNSLVRRSVWISGLKQCKPESAISNDPKQGCWQSVEYEARYNEKEPKGSMLLAGPETAAPPIGITLKEKGWHAIYVGMKSFLGYGDTNAVKLKLEGDPSCWLLSQTIGMQTGSRSVVARADWIRYQIQDCFFRCVELNGQFLEIAQNRSGLIEPCAIAYIRLVPLASDEIRSLEARRRRKASGRLICMNDVFSFMYERRPTSKEEIYEEIFPFKDTDYQAIYWCTARADNCLHPTRVGTILGTQGRDFPRLGDRYVAESMKILLSRNIDPFATALEFTHQMGMEFHASIRVESFSVEPPWDRAYFSLFFRDHPELRCVDYDHRSIARMSYAFPEVQDHMLELIREIVAYGVDGINLIFTRAQPYILYEKPVVEAFRQRYGITPQDTHERDPRLLDLRASLMTGFLRRVRNELDRSSKGGKRLQLSAVVMANEDINRFHALDLAGWVREGLIDELSPGPFGMNREEPTLIELPYFSQLTKGSRCRLCPTLRPTLVKVDEAMPTALDFYQKGANGFAVFDMNLFQRFPMEWAVWQQLGRKDELQEIIRSVNLKPTTLQLRTLGGLVVDKYSPRWAY
jgi:hypothetical protein